MDIADQTLSSPFLLKTPLNGKTVDNLRSLPPRREEALSRTTATPVVDDTLGWDTVFAVPVSQVNNAWSNPNTYPTTFNQTVNGELYDTSIDGNFGAWSIGLGGAGSIVNLSVPVASGTMTVGTNSFSLAGASIVLEVKMNYLPQPGSGSANGLLVSVEAMDDSLEPCHVLSITIPGQRDQTVLSAAQSAFQSYFNGSVGQGEITQIFNTVNLNQIADKEYFQWLQPTYVSYAYSDADNINDALFAVLCMVNNDQNGRNTNEISPGAIPSGAQSGFSISNTLFLQEMVLPALPTVFGSNNDNATIDSSYFELINNNTQIINAKNIPMATVKYGGISYYPQCTTLNVTVNATELTIYTKVQTEISPGIESYVEQTAYYGVQLVSSNGQQYLSFYETQSPVVNNWSTQSVGITITEVIVGIIGAVAGVVAGAVLSGVKMVVAIIAIALVAGFAAATPALIRAVQANGVAGNVPPITELVSAATGNIQWTGSQAFYVTVAQLNGALQLGGNAFPSST